MLLIVKLAISLALCLLCTALVWSARPLHTWIFALTFGMSFILDVLGVVFSVNLYPWTALLVLLVAVSAGLWLGRAISIKRLWPFLLLLVILSLLDATQIILTHLSSSAQTQGTQSAHVPAADLYINFLFFLPGGQNYVIGILDLWLIAAIAEYWRRRNAAFWLALSPGALALIVAYGLLLLFPGLEPIALIPFLAAGWLCSVAFSQSRGKRESGGVPAGMRASRQEGTVGGGGDAPPSDV
jgi:hypothetical protein